ncbi:MAG: hypothetical protein QW472_05155, partial [Candidatus Aenigmatarchaeota archaeon]
YTQRIGGPYAPPEYNISGQIKVNILQPYYQQIFNVTQQILIRFNTTSDCPGEGLIANATYPLAQIELRSPYGEWETCSPLNNEYDGWYNCTWDSTNKKEGYWSINLTASKLPDYNLNETMFVNWFWLENIYSVAENASVSPSEAGWSRVFNYSIEVYDQEGDTINCSLFISKDNKQTWEYKGSYIIQGSPGIPTQGTCWVALHDFTCEDIDKPEGQEWIVSKAKWFKWQIENGEPSNTYNTSEFQGPNITESQVLISYIAGNDSYVNRSSGINQVVRLAVNVFDLENLSYASNVNVSFWVTHDNSNYQLDIVNQTDSLGNASYYFNPDCSYSTGKQYWIAGVTDSCYMNTNASSNFTTYIIGDLSNSILQPLNGVEYKRGENVTIRGYVSSDCSWEVLNESVSVNFISIHSETGQQFVCSPILNEGLGYYNCTFNTSSPILMPARFYNIKFNSSKQYYNPSVVIGNNNFWIETAPTLTNPSVNNTQGGWGEWYTFSVNVTDEDRDDVRVWLWRRRVGSETWIQFGSPLTKPAGIVSQVLNFTRTFTCDDLNLGENQVWEFMFNATDDPTTYADDKTNSTTISLTLERDDISLIYVEGNNSVVNRSIAPSQSNATLRVQVIDTDRNLAVSSEPGTARFYVTTNPYDINSYTVDKTITVGTETGGYLTDIFPSSPRCNYKIGPLRWKVEFGSTCYKTTNSSVFFLNTTTYPLQVEIQRPNNETFRRATDTILLRGNVSDDCGLVSGAEVRIKTVKGVFSYGCPDDVGVNDEGNGWYNCSFISSLTWSLGYYNATMQASKEFYESSELKTKINASVLVTNPEIQGLSVTTSDSVNPGGWGELWTFSAQVRDIDQGISELGFERLNISLWIDFGSGYQLVNSTICAAPTCSEWTEISFTQHNFNCQHIGTRAYKWNVSDVWSYRAEASDSVTVNPDDIEFPTSEIVEPVSIEREGLKEGVFVFRIKDKDNNSYVPANVNASIWFTTNASDPNSWDYTRYLTTNSSGYVTYNFDPNCSYSVGTQYWKGGSLDNCYEVKNMTPRTFEIKGQLKNQLTQPSFGSVYNVTQLIPINFTTLSDCSAYREDENPVINASSYTVELRSPLLIWESCLPVNNSYQGWYNCTWDSTNKKEGYWSIRLNSSKEYFNSNSTIYENWFWLENVYSIAENASVSPEEGGWTRVYNYTIDIYDQEGDTINCSLFISKDNQATWIYKGSYVIVGTPGIPTQGKCFVEVHDFSCDDIGTDNYFKWQIENGEPANAFNTSAIQGPNITESQVIISYIEGNDSYVNRSFGINQV